MRIKAHPRLSLRTIIFGCFALILTWLVVTRSLAAYLAVAAPQTALWLSPRQPDALVNLADRSLNALPNVNASSAGGQDQTPEQNKPNTPETKDESSANVADHAATQPESASGGGTGAVNNGNAHRQNINEIFAAIGRNRSLDLPAIRAQVESALMKQPLNARALRVLGQLANTANDNAEADKLMAAAAELSLHESIAVYWLMRKSTESGDYKAAVSYADALLRTDPELSPYVMPVLARLAEDKTANSLVKAVLDENPPWRPVFFGEFLRSVTDVRTPLDLLLALRKTQAPPTSDEIAGYIAFLISHNFYDLAYYTWLQFLPPEELHNAGLLFNGNFDVAPSGMPFDWVIKQGSGVTVDIVPTPERGGERALLVDFLYGRVDYHSVTELVLLAPGTYQFSGQYKGKLIGPRGLKWRLTCAGESQTRIGESPMISGLASSWKKVDFIFTVPAADCRAQYVRLDLDARMASEQLVSGSMLFDELRISRILNPPSSAAAVK